MKRWTFGFAALGTGLVLGALLSRTLLHGQGPGVPAKPMPTELTSYRDVVQKVLPAVVSIETRARPGKAQQADAHLPEEQRRFLEEFRRSPVQPNEAPRHGFGSGFFLDSSGVIVTNAHVLEGADLAVVTLQDGRKFSTKDLRIDKRTDLALLILSEKNERFPHLDLGDSDRMEIGDRVLAVGAPFGLAGSVTHGIISAKGRNGLNVNQYEDFLQTDAAINPGNSGGPLVSLDGKVVGISAAIKSKSGGFQGVGLAVASNLAKNVLQALRADGVVKRGYLGVQIQELELEVAQRLALPPDAGVVLSEVFDNTPAAKAGLKPGDLLVRLAGKPVRTSQAVQTLVGNLPLQKPVEAEVRREGQALKATVRIEEQPQDYASTGVTAPKPNINVGQPQPFKALGVDLVEVDEALAAALGLRKETRGVVVVRVHEEGALGPLRRGMVLQKLDGAATPTLAATQQALSRGSLQKGLLLQAITAQGGVNYHLLKARPN